MCELVEENHLNLPSLTLDGEEEGYVSNISALVGIEDGECKR